MLGIVLILAGGIWRDVKCATSEETRSEVFALISLTMVQQIFSLEMKVF